MQTDVYDQCSYLKEKIAVASGKSQEDLKNVLVLHQTEAAGEYYFEKGIPIYIINCFKNTRKRCYFQFTSGFLGMFHSTT